MTTKRENILATIRTKLVDTAGVGTRIFRTRVDPIARAESPAIIIQPIRDVCVQTTSLPKLDWTMTVRITVIERADIPDQAADDTVESLHAKVMADLTLGGYAHDACCHHCCWWYWCWCCKRCWPWPQEVQLIFDLPPPQCGGFFIWR